MATLLLQTAGAFVGGMLGGPVGAVLGQAVGAVAGATIDQQVMGRGAPDRTGPRVTAMSGISSTEGSPIPRVYGRARIGGQVIWATRFEEVSTTTRTGASGGKGGRSSSTTTFSYFANFAVALCEGPIADVRRIWADGREIDQTRFSIRLHRGSETQSPDALIVAKEGAEQAPAYRGVAYVVFERMPLADFGNRVPQLTFEVVRPVGGLGQKIRAIDLIPGASEFAYAPNSVTQTRPFGVSSIENRHQLVRHSDWTASIDALQALCPNLESVALVVSWFGDDLRAGECTIAPRVENATKSTREWQWSVAGLTRDSARVVSQVDGRPAYGGTPSDQSVLDAIADLKARGLSVIFYPFVMMDVPAGNALVNPWTAAVPQPAFPWRGRITCHPASGVSGSPDGTTAAGAQIATFFGSSTPTSGEWSFRRFILHYAQLCAQAGGVDAFLIGSELAALTRVRSSASFYPAASALAQLAADCREVLGAGTKISYAADWTEYGAHVTPGGDVRFPLDPLWADANVDFVGIDAYWPLGDWRDGADHADAELASAIYDPEYLRGRMTAGEAYDWYYASSSARAEQVRTPINDTAYGKHWIFRQKDIAGWWSAAHYDRIGGTEAGEPTGWIPRSKPIWIIEAGCPAVDRGANAPNVFPDEKSSEGGLPHFSRGYRDDLMQARMLAAFIDHFDPEHASFVDSANPTSPSYGGRMVDVARIHLWAWDARPFPAFPSQSGVWGDAANWRSGHWLNGRLESVELDELVRALAADVDSIDLPAIDGVVDGYVLERPMSPRAAIEPLTDLFGFDLSASGGRIAARMRYAADDATIGNDDLASRKDGSLIARTRAQESEIASQLSLTFWDGEGDYRTATVSARRSASGSRRKRQLDLGIVLQRPQAQRLVDTALDDMWVQREAVTFSLPPSAMAFEPGDTVRLDADRAVRIVRISDGLVRDVHARLTEPSVYDRPLRNVDREPSLPPPVPGPPFVQCLDLAIARAEPAVLQYVAASAEPWAGPLAIWRAVGASSFEFVRTIDHRAIVGKTLAALPAGVLGRIDHANELPVELAFGALASVTTEEMLGGRNLAAVLDVAGNVEIIGFVDAILTGARQWKLSRLLRGLGGEEHLAARTLPPGSTFLLLDQAVVPLTADLALMGAPQRYRIGPASGDFADPACVELIAQASPKSLMPYAPAKVRAMRVSGGIRFEIVRRGRLQSDAWETLEIPLGEEREAYEIDILAGASIVRTIASSSASTLYGAAEEATDFGGAQTELALRVYQMSALVGRGFPFSATVPIS